MKTKDRTAADLRSWSGTARRAGQAEAAELLARGADAVESGSQDLALAVELITYAQNNFGRPNTGSLVSALERGAELLS